MTGAVSGQPAPEPTWQQVRDTFLRRYRAMPRIFRAPGRVNLIGEHTDYNDGFVMPAALEFYTYVAVGPRNNQLLSIHSIDFEHTVEVPLGGIYGAPASHWSDYPRGVAAVLRSAGHRLGGANLVIKGEVPIGAGLSSSAALEVATAFALLANSGIELSRTDIARLCQQAEHQYAGTRCGIMDQFISCFGQAGHALLLDCRTLDHQPLAINRDARIVVCNTNVRHELAGGEYNQRRADCEAGVRYLQKFLPGIQALRDVTSGDLEEYGARLPQTVYRRCRHVVTENARVLRATEALRAGDLKLFGDLMFESHRSLQYDYEVSCPELDLMVNIALTCPGVYGSRMTGGGFGGCTVSLVRSGNVAEFVATVQRLYTAATELHADVYVCSAGDGAAEVTGAKA